MSDQDPQDKAAEQGQEDAEAIREVANDSAEGKGAGSDGAADVAGEEDAVDQKLSE